MLCTGAATLPCRHRRLPAGNAAKAAGAKEAARGGQGAQASAEGGAAPMTEETRAPGSLQKIVAPVFFGENKIPPGRTAWAAGRMGGARIFFAGPAGQGGARIFFTGPAGQGRRPDFFG